MNRIVFPLTRGIYVTHDDSPCHGQAFCQYNGTIIDWAGMNDRMYRDWCSIRLLCPSLIDLDRPMWLRIEWDTQDVPFPTSGASVVFIQGYLVVFGGYSFRYRIDGNHAVPLNPSCTNEVFILNLHILRWTKVVYQDQKVPSPRDNCSSWAYEKMACFFGGYGNPGRPEEFHQEEFLYDVESEGTKGWNNQLLQFDLSTNSWSLVQTSGIIPAPRAEAAACINKNIVYLFGGRKKYDRLNDLYTLNMKTLIWTEVEMSDLPVGRSWSTISVTPDNSRLYVWAGLLPGHNNWLSTKEILVADLVQKRWSKLADAVDLRFWHVGGFHDGMMVVYGGSGADNEYPDRYLEYRRVQPASLRQLAFDKVTIAAARKYQICSDLASRLALRSLLHGSPKDFNLEHLTVIDILRLASL